MVSTGSQDLSHVISSSGLVSGGPGGQEITLTINNSSLSQALAQVHAHASASSSSNAAGNPQEITLTISGMVKKHSVFSKLVQKHAIHNKPTDEIEIPLRCNAFIDFLTQAILLHTGET